MYKNVASQKLIVFAFDSTTNLPKTGDAANLTAYVSKDYGSVTVLGDTSATEMDSTNAKGYYLFDLTQAETNADTLLFSAKSSTSNIVVIGVPATVFTEPNNFHAMSIDSSGRVDVIKVNGTSQTAGDIYSKVSGLTFTVANQVDVNAKSWAGGTIPAVNVTGVPLVDAKYLLGTVFATPNTAGLMDVNAKQINAVSTSSVTTISANVGTTQPVNFTGTGASALAKSDMVDVAGVAVSTSTAQLGVNVVNFGGSAGTFASGRPEVNATHWSGTAVASPNTAGVPIVDTRELVRQGTAQSTGNSTTAIKLDSGASATTNFYKYMRIQIISGTGAPESALCAAYDGSTKIATVAPAWPTAPDNTSVFQVLPAQVDLELIAGAGVSTSTAQLGVNVVTNGDKTGYSLTQGFPTNFSSLSIDASGRIDLGKWIGTAPLALTSQQVQAVVPNTQKVDVDTIKTNPVVNAGTITFPSGATLASTSNITAAAGVALTSSYDFAKGTVAVTESYNADGSAPTPVQALLVIMQMLTEMSKSGSTITVKKLDGSTTAFTLTLDDATTPASITRTG